MALTSGCNRGNVAPGAGGPPGGAPVPVEVQWTSAAVQQIQDFREFTGRTAAIDSVELRARVGGYLRQSPRSERAGYFTNEVSNSESETRDVLVSSSDSGTSTLGSPDFIQPLVTAHEGDFVRKGDLLFQIERNAFELALKQAEGNLEAARAQLRRLNDDKQRVLGLLRSNSISQAEYEQVRANEEELGGQIKALEASVDAARLQLGFTQVKSPIDGVLGNSHVTNGNIIEADSTILSTVVSIDPIFVYFDVDENSLLDYRKRMVEGSVKSAKDAPIPIRLGLANEEGFPHEGVIDFVDNTTNPRTGNTRLRGMFRNPNRMLSPGLFARVQSPFTEAYDAVLVPTKAVGMDQQGRFVMEIVEGKAVRRSVIMGAIHGDQTVIRQGLKGGEKIVVSPLQRVRPGTSVKFED